MIVLKFGGTSVGTVESLNNVKKIVEGLQEPAIVVVSALGGLTDRLIETAGMAASGNNGYVELMDGIRTRHLNIIQGVIAPEKREKTAEKIEPILNELRRLYDGVSLIGDLPERTLDQIVSCGERMSSVIVADMIDGATHHNSLDYIKTEKWFDKNIAASRLTEQLIKEEYKEVSYPVVTGGFISRDKDTGEITNLGRGGSDYTAALIAAALDADVLQIWTDVDGFMTSDPRIIPNARVIPEMSFVESMDLCTFGAKVIYPPTIYPVFHKNISIRILNTFHPDAPGTLIMESARLNFDGRNNVTGLSVLKDTTLISLRGRRANGVQDLDTRAANALARKGITIILKSADDFDTGFSYAIPAKCEKDAVRLLKEEFAPELVDNLIEVIEATDGLATLAVVGDRIKSIADISIIIRNLLEKEGINVVTFSDKASETTLSFVIKESDAVDALRNLHATLFH